MLAWVEACMRDLEEVFTQVRVAGCMQGLEVVYTAVLAADYTEARAEDFMEDLVGVCTLVRMRTHTAATSLLGMSL